MHRLQLTGGSRRAVVLLQLLLEAATLLLVVKLGKKLGLARRAQLIALAIGLLCPFLPLYSGLLLTEVLATFLITLTCYFFVCALTESGGLSWVKGGVGCGAALLVRPDLLLAVLLLLAVAGVVTLRQRGFAAVMYSLFSCVSLLLLLMPWMARNQREFGALRPLGGVVEQTKTDYARWLDTWLYDPKDLHAHWWHALEGGVAIELPSWLPESERVVAQSALLLAQKQGTFSGQPAQQFAQLALHARKTRPLRVWLVTPVRRAMMTWLRAPSYVSVSWLKPLVYLFWIGILGATTVGLLMSVGQRQLILLLPLAVLAGRAVLPVISAVAIEPRYMFEALPICFLLAGAALSKVVTRLYPLLIRGEAQA